MENGKIKGKLVKNESEIVQREKLLAAGYTEKRNIWRQRAGES